MAQTSTKLEDIASDSENKPESKLAVVYRGVRYAMARARTYRTTVDELSRLDERQLADIGLAPGQIEAVAARCAEKATRKG